MFHIIIFTNRSEKSLVAQRRIGYIIDYLTFEVYKYKCRGLYENHKYLYTLLLALKIDIQRKSIVHDEFHAFIKGLICSFSIAEAHVCSYKHVQVIKK